MGLASNKLNPDAVRLRAAGIPGCIELPGAPSTSTSACSFLVGCPGEGLPRNHHTAILKQGVEDLARITIFCDTGTVATSRVLNGLVRSTFRKHVSSLDVVERSLRNPSELPKIDWQLVSIFDEKELKTLVADHPSNTVSKNLELIDVGTAILRGEREKLVIHIRALETATPRVKGAAQKQVPGMELQFSLAAGPMKHVDQCLNDIQKMGKLVSCVSTNGVGTVFLYGNGGVAYTPSIPRALYYRLSQLKNSKSYANRPSYVSLGTRERFFVAFHDGTFSYKGPKGLDRELRKLSTPPLSVTFGITYDSFFLVYDDGSWKYQGKGISDDFEKQLLAHKKNTVLACVNLGPQGEWFFRTKNGEVAWGGVSDDMEKAIQELLDEDHEVRFLDFGESGSYYVSYD